MLSASKQSIDAAVSLEIPDSVLVERVEGRWIHPASGRSYHTKFAPPKVEGKDDVWTPHHCTATPAVFTLTEPVRPPRVRCAVCREQVTGEALIHRSDDNPEVLKKRLTAFHEQTAPVVDYYRKQGKFAGIDANRPVPNVFGAIMAAINKPK
jgi:adenylate kinase